MTEFTFTDQQAVTPTTDVALPGGLTLTVHRLTRGDQYWCLEQYAKYVQMIAAGLGREPTLQDIRELMPEALAISYGQIDLSCELQNGDLAPGRVGQEPAVKFLSCFTELPEAAQPADEALAEEFGVPSEAIAYWREQGWIAPPVTVLDAFTLDDWRVLWEAVWQFCQYPFAFRLKQARKTEIPAALEFALLTSPLSSSSYDAPASTPPIAPSTSSTSSPSPARNGSTKRSSTRSAPSR